MVYEEIDDEWSLIIDVDSWGYRHKYPDGSTEYMVKGYPTEADARISLAIARRSLIAQKYLYDVLKA